MSTVMDQGFRDWHQARVALLCFTKKGLDTGRRVRQALLDVFPEATITLEAKSSRIPGSIIGSARDWAGERFGDCDALIILGACGICVRLIAPFVLDKRKDPAVLCIDEEGRFCIPLLSGHLGGANELAQLLGEKTGCLPVITTATDLESRFAVDLFARKNGLKISDMALAKEVSAALLAGERVGVISDLPLEGKIPEGLLLGEEGRGQRLGILITYQRQALPFEKTLLLIPACLGLGMGCRAGAPFGQVKALAEEALEGYLSEALAGLFSLDRKKGERAFLELSGLWGIPFETFSAGELLKVQGEFCASEFVRQTVGVDNVCERAALAGLGGEGRLLQRKLAREGVTAALALAERRLSFG